MTKIITPRCLSKFCIDLSCFFGTEKMEKENILIHKFLGRVRKYVTAI